MEQAQVMDDDEHTYDTTTDSYPMADFAEFIIDTLIMEYYERWTKEFINNGHN